MRCIFGIKVVDYYYRYARVTTQNRFTFVGAEKRHDDGTNSAPVTVQFLTFHKANA
ncbi:MAG: hypothetical protein NTY19_51130 [Planctomycetota bacterium]|nr:hypothetical protein [Planctomycetota bacterium]